MYYTLWQAFLTLLDSMMSLPPVYFNIHINLWHRVTDYFEVVKHLKVCKTLSSGYIFLGITVYFRNPVWTRWRKQKLYPPHANSPGDSAHNQSINLSSFTPIFEIFLYFLLKIWFSDLFSSLAAFIFDISVPEIKTKYSSNFLYFQELNFSKFWHLGKRLKIC